MDRRPQGQQLSGPRAKAEMPNNDSLRQIEEHELTEAQETLPLAELVKAFPQPTRVRVLH
jgi:hypothetical protein